MKGSVVVPFIRKSPSSAIPIAESLAAGIKSTVNSNQEKDGFEPFLNYLESTITKEDRPIIDKRMTSPESLDLIKECFLKASQSSSTKRKEYIASLLKKSLTDDGPKYIKYQRLLSILDELNDLDVLILKSYTMVSSPLNTDEFWDEHKDTLSPPLSNRGSTQEKTDQHSIYKTHQLHLINMGLLKASLKNQERYQLPEIEGKTGIMNAQRCELTGIGRLFLRSIDQDGSI